MIRFRKGVSIGQEWFAFPLWLSELEWQTIRPRKELYILTVPTISAQKHPHVKCICRLLRGCMQLTYHRVGCTLSQSFRLYRVLLRVQYVLITYDCRPTACNAPNKDTCFRHPVFNTQDRESSNIMVHVCAEL